MKEYDQSISCFFDINYRYRAEAAQQESASDAKETENAEEDEDEDSATFQEVEKLQNLGINAGDIQKLKSGVSTRFFSLALTPRRDVSQLKV